MPSISCSAAILASRRLWMPLSRIGPSQFARMSGSWSQFSPGFWKTPANATPVASGADLSRQRHLLAPEDRVARVVRDALVLEEGRVAAIEIERPPAEQRRVERDDQVGVAGRLGTMQEGRGDLVVCGPVQLVPARPLAVGRGDVLHLVGALRRVHVRQPELGRRAGAGEVAVRMGERLHPDRREEDRRGHARPQDGGGEIDLRRLAAPAPLDLPAPEGRGIGARAVRVTRPGEDVGEGLGAEDLGGLRLELREVVGDGGRGSRLRHGRRV